MILKLLNKQITEETTTLPQIPVKTRQKKSGTYRSKCRAIIQTS